MECIYETAAYPLCHHSGQLILTPDGQQIQNTNKPKYKTTEITN